MAEPSSVPSASDRSSRRSGGGAMGDFLSRFPRSLRDAAQYYMIGIARHDENSHRRPLLYCVEEDRSSSLPHGASRERFSWEVWNGALRTLLLVWKGDSSASGSAPWTSSSLVQSIGGRPILESVAENGYMNGLNVPPRDGAPEGDDFEAMLARAMEESLLFEEEKNRYSSFDPDELDLYRALAQSLDLSLDEYLVIEGLIAPQQEAVEVDPLNSAGQGPESVEDGSIESVPVEDVEPPLEDLSELSIDEFFCLWLDRLVKIFRVKLHPEEYQFSESRIASMVDRLEELESSILEILSSILLDPILVEKNKENGQQYFVFESGYQADMAFSSILSFLHILAEFFETVQPLTSQDMKMLEEISRIAHPMTIVLLVVLSSQPLFSRQSAASPSDVPIARLFSLLPIFSRLRKVLRCICPSESVITSIDSCVVETPHPYPSIFTRTYQVSLPRSEFLVVQFHPDSSTPGLQDVVNLSASCEKSIFTTDRVPIHIPFWGSRAQAEHPSKFPIGSILVPSSSVDFSLYSPSCFLEGEASESRFGFRATCLGFRVESDACTSSFIYASEAIESASLLLSQQIMSSCAPGPSPRIRGAAEELLFDSFLSLSVLQNGFDIERVKNLMNTQLQSSFGSLFSWNDHSPDLARDSLSQLSQTLRGILHVDGTCEEFSSFSSGDKLSNDDENFLRELIDFDPRDPTCQEFGSTLLLNSLESLYDAYTSSSPVDSFRSISYDAFTPATLTNQHNLSPFAKGEEQVSHISSEADRPIHSLNPTTEIILECVSRTCFAAALCCGSGCPTIETVRSLVEADSDFLSAGGDLSALTLADAHHVAVLILLWQSCVRMRNRIIRNVARELKSSSDDMFSSASIPESYNALVLSHALRVLVKMRVLVFCGCRALTVDASKVEMYSTEDRHDAARWEALVPFSEQSFEYFDESNSQKPPSVIPATPALLDSVGIFPSESAIWNSKMHDSHIVQFAAMTPSPALSPGDTKNIFSTSSPSIYNPFSKSVIRTVRLVSLMLQEILDTNVPGLDTLVRIPSSFVRSFDVSENDASASTSQNSIREELSSLYRACLDVHEKLSPSSLAECQESLLAVVQKVSTWFLSRLTQAASLRELRAWSITQLLTTIDDLLDLARQNGGGFSAHAISSFRESFSVVDDSSSTLVRSPLRSLHGASRHGLRAVEQASRIFYAHCARTILHFCRDRRTSLMNRNVSEMAYAAYLSCLCCRIRCSPHDAHALLESTGVLQALHEALNLDVLPDGDLVPDPFASCSGCGDLLPSYSITRPLFTPSKISDEETADGANSRDQAPILAYKNGSYDQETQRLLFDNDPQIPCVGSNSWDFRLRLCDSTESVASSSGDASSIANPFHPICELAILISPVMDGDAAPRSASLFLDGEKISSVENDLDGWVRLRFPSDRNFAEELQKIFVTSRLDVPNRQYWGDVCLRQVRVFSRTPPIAFRSASFDSLVRESAFGAFNFLGSSLASSLVSVSGASSSRGASSSGEMDIEALRSSVELLVSGLSHIVDEFDALQPKLGLSDSCDLKEALSTLDKAVIADEKDSYAANEKNADREIAQESFLSPLQSIQSNLYIDRIQARELASSFYSTVLKLLSAECDQLELSLRSRKQKKSREDSRSEDENGISKRGDVATVFQQSEEEERRIKVGILREQYPKLREDLFSQAFIRYPTVDEASRRVQLLNSFSESEALQSQLESGDILPLFRFLDALCLDTEKIFSVFKIFLVSKVNFSTFIENLGSSDEDLFLLSYCFDSSVESSIASSVDDVFSSGYSNLVVYYAFEKFDLVVPILSPHSRDSSCSEDRSPVEEFSRAHFWREVHRRYKDSFADSLNRIRLVLGKARRYLYDEGRFEQSSLTFNDLVTAIRFSNNVGTSLCLSRHCIVSIGSYESASYSYLDNPVRYQSSLAKEQAIFDSQHSMDHPVISRIDDLDVDDVAVHDSVILLQALPLSSGEDDSRAFLLVSLLLLFSNVKRILHRMVSSSVVVSLMIKLISLGSSSRLRTACLEVLRRILPLMEDHALVFSAPGTASSPVSSPSEACERWFDFFAFSFARTLQSEVRDFRSSSAVMSRTSHFKGGRQVFCVQGTIDDSLSFILECSQVIYSLLRGSSLWSSVFRRSFSSSLVAFCNFSGKLDLHPEETSEYWRCLGYLFLRTALTSQHLKGEFDDIVRSAESDAEVLSEYEDSCLVCLQVREGSSLRFDARNRQTSAKVFLEPSSRKAMVEIRTSIRDLESDVVCRFCEIQLTHSNRCTMFDHVGPGLENVCKDPWCLEKAENCCPVVLPCGHLCHGIREEEKHLPCLHGCDSSVLQPYDDMCSICYCESLGAAPCIQLECGHIFHASCIRSMIRTKWNGITISFSFMQCPLCKTEMRHPSLQQDLEPFYTIREKIIDQGRARLQAENFSEHLVEGSEWYGRDLDYILYQFNFYQCSSCLNPYCGGARQCGAGQGRVSESDLICPSCIAGDAEVCPIHNRQFIEYQCRFCCNVASYFCFGSTHFCNRCHTTLDYKAYGCPGPAVCPYGAEHSNKPSEHCLGCAICRAPLIAEIRRRALESDPALAEAIAAGNGPKETVLEGVHYP